MVKQTLNCPLCGITKVIKSLMNSAETLKVLVTKGYYDSLTAGSILTPNTALLPTGLQHQGIFRVSGSQVEVNDIKNSFERGESPPAVT